MTDKKVFDWLNEVVGKEKWKIFGLLMLQAILGVSMVGYAMLLRQMIDAAVQGEQGQFVTWAGCLVLLILFQICCRGCNRYLEEDAKASLENRLKQRLLGVLLKKEYASVTSVHSGEWMNRFTSDAVFIAEGLVQILPGTVGMIIKMSAALLMILWLQPNFGVVLIPGGIVLVIFTYGFRRLMKKLHKDIQEKDGRLRIFLQEHLENLLIVRVFAREEQLEKEAAGRMGEHRRARRKRSLFSTFCNMGFSGIMRGVYVFGAIYCARGIMEGTVSYGTLTAILQLISQVQTPMANISGYLPRYYAVLASAERLMEAEDFREDCLGEVKSMDMVRSYYQNTFDSIGLEEVSFTYMPPVREMDEIACENAEARMPVVLKQVNLEICKGEYVAFTGHSGSGKSTVMKLFLCLYSLDAGRRYLKDKNGRKEELDSSWRRLFSYVPQGNQLMSGSIREMIAFADKQQMTDEQRIRCALKISCADEFVDLLENGMDTVLGERGMGLSEGQMQRLAIARAVFSESPIMILDEATSALDDETEQRLLKNLRSMTDKTVLLVTHRSAALEICDKQVVISEEGIRIEG